MNQNTTAAPNVSTSAAPVTSTSTMPGTSPNYYGPTVKNIKRISKIV
jgi:hypothetical protein